MKFEERLRDGKGFEIFVQKRLRPFGLDVGVYTSVEGQHQFGESRMGLEIKYDRKMRETGNVFIEVSEKRHADEGTFRPAGICANDNHWLYGIGDEQEFVVFGRRTLQRIWFGVQRGLLATTGITQKQIATSVGFVIPLALARSWAERVFVESPAGGWMVATFTTPLRVDDFTW